MILFVARGVQEGVLGQLEFPEESRVIGGSEVELVVFLLYRPYVLHFPFPLAILGAALKGSVVEMEWL